MARELIKCEVHKIEMQKSVGWYGIKYECKKCLAEGHTPNGKNDTHIARIAANELLPGTGIK